MGLYSYNKMLTFTYDGRQAWGRGGAGGGAWRRFVATSHLHGSFRGRLNPVSPVTINSTRLQNFALVCEPCIGNGGGREQAEADDFQTREAPCLSAVFLVGLTTEQIAKRFCLSRTTLKEATN